MKSENYDIIVLPGDRIIDLSHPSKDTLINTFI